jgi:WD40 repeat protein
MPPEPKPPAKYQPKAAKPIPVDQQLCCVRLSPDGKRLVAGSFEGTVRRWDASASPPVESPALIGHNGWVQAMDFDSDGKRLFTADSWGRLTCWPIDQKEPKPLWSVADAHDGWIHALAVSKGGAVVATGGRDRTIRITTPATGKAVCTLATDEDVLAVAFHPDGKSLMSGDLKGVVKQWDLATGKPVREMDARVMFLRDRIQDVGGVRCFAFSADGSTLFAGGSQPKTGAFVQGLPLVLAFDWKTGQGKPVYKGANDNEGYILDLRWHPDGFLIAVSSGQPGQGKLFFQRPGDAQPFFAQALPNPHSLTFFGKRVVVSATNANSAGNGRVVGKDESAYLGNYSPLHVFELPG